MPNTVGAASENGSLATYATNYTNKLEEAYATILPHRNRFSGRKKNTDRAKKNIKENASTRTERIEAKFKKYHARYCKSETNLNKYKQQKNIKKIQKYEKLLGDSIKRLEGLIAEFRKYCSGSIMPEIMRSYRENSALSYKVSLKKEEKSPSAHRNQRRMGVYPKKPAHKNPRNIIGPISERKGTGYDVTSKTPKSDLDISALTKTLEQTTLNPASSKNLQSKGSRREIPENQAASGFVKRMKKTTLRQIKQKKASGAESGKSVKKPFVKPTSSRSVEPILKIPPHHEGEKKSALANVRTTRGSKLKSKRSSERNTSTPRNSSVPSGKSRL